MKLVVFIFSILFSFPVDSINYDCSTSPSHLQNLRNCCNMPNFIDRKLENICFEKCKGKNTNCTIDCYFKDSKILFEEILNQAIKRSSLLSKSPFYVYSIYQAIENCQLKEDRSSRQSFINFFDCLYDLIALDCNDFVEIPECKIVKQQFEYCKINCSVMPLWIPCCQPKLLSEDITSKCRQKPKLCAYELSIQYESKCIIDIKNRCISNSFINILNGKAENIFRLFKKDENFEKHDFLMEKASKACASKVTGSHKFKFQTFF